MGQPKSIKKYIMKTKFITEQVRFSREVAEVVDTCYLINYMYGERASIERPPHEEDCYASLSKD